MSLKTKLISSISAFVLVLALLVVGVFALPQANVPLGGTINFQATSVYAEITGTISGQENGPTTLPKLEFSNGQTPDTSGWAKGDLVFDPNASPIQIQIAINVKNLSAERSLFVKVDDLIGAVTNLTKSVMVGAEDQEGAYVKVLPLQSVDYVISLSPTDEGEPVTGEYNYLITLIDESETQDIEIQAKPNMETLGSVSDGGTFDLGDTVALTATPSGSNTFLAWATLTDPNTMEILSTSSTYSFELTMDSPRTYYALFNKTTSTRQPVGELIYTFYNEAKLAMITDTTSTSVPSGDFTIPSVVPSGENSYKVYSIGGIAFYNCSSLASITIPEGVTSISLGAFDGCSSLEAFYGNGNSYYTIDDNRALIVDGGETLLAYAIANTATSYLIPEGVSSIGSSAFYGCSSLTSISLPSTVISIGGGAFFDCSSLEAFYGNGNSYYTIDGNRALIVDGGERLLAYAVANLATSYSIPEGVTSIGYFAFEDCSSLTSITLSSKLTSIDNFAFDSCSGLTSISIPEGMTSIGSWAFKNCSSLTEITINGNISTLGSGAFQYCTNLTKLTLGAKVTSIPSNLFSTDMLTNLNEIVVHGDLNSTTFPSGTWYKDDDPTEVTNFSGAGTYSTTQPTIITVEANQASLGSISGGGAYAIGDTVALTATPSGSNTFLAWATSTDPNTMEILSTSSTYSFELTMDSPRTYYALFNQTTSTSQTVGNLIYTFYNEAKLASVTKPTSTSLSGAIEIPSVVSSGENGNSYKVYSIGRFAFDVCMSLTSITIPEGVTSIEEWAFSYCTSLTSITLPSTLTSIGADAFFDCGSLVSIKIPEGVTSIGDSAFDGCSSLTSITIPEGVTEIGSSAFRGCSSLEAFNGDGNEYYTIDDNRALLVDGGKTLLAYAPANTATSYTIPEGVTSIGSSAFYECSSLTSIKILEGVTSIGGSAFSGCSSLTSITLPITLTSIGDYTFSNCGSLTSITIPGRVISIGQYAFNGCYALAIVYNNSSLEITKGESGHGRVAYYAKEVVANGQQAQGSIEDIGNVNYYINETTGEYIALAPSISRNSVTQITIAAGAKEINLYAFNGCISLTSIIIPEGVTSIGSGAFRECSSLTSITIPEGVTSIGNSSFYNCSKLTSITIPEGVTSIGNSAFSRCSSLTSITLPSTLTSIRSEAFYNCSGLTEITINGKISTLEFYAFSTCTNLTKLTLGANVKSIPSNLFTNSNLTNLNEIVVEEGSSLTAALPSGETWVKDGEEVTMLDGAGVYAKQA